MIYLNENEERIIGKFVEGENKYENQTLVLIWSDGSQVIAKYDSFIEDEANCELEDEYYEEFTSFVFIMISGNGNPPIDVSQDGFFLINYHNFPKDILANGEKIN